MPSTLATIARRSINAETVTQAVARMPAAQSRILMRADLLAADQDNPIKSLDIRLEISRDDGQSWVPWTTLRIGGRPPSLRGRSQPYMDAPAPPAAVLVRVRELPSGNGVECGLALEAR